MKIQDQTSVVVFAFVVFSWVDCANVPSCATMKTWFPGTPSLSLADNLPYQLSVSGIGLPGESVPTYTPESSHIVYLNGSYITNEMRMRNFLAFIVYAENSVTKYSNGHFENLPAGVEQINCSSLKIVQNSTSAGNWTSLKLQWRAPKDGHLAGNITFRASFLEKTNPLMYYEGFTAHLGYECPMVNCRPCPGGHYLRDSYGCSSCQCGDPCANITCPFNGNCVPSKDQKTVQCKCDIVCTEEYNPVCGTDGKTHSNVCSMTRQACVDKKSITVSYKGECSAAGNLGSTFPGPSLMLAFLVFLWFSV